MISGEILIIVDTSSCMKHGFAFISTTSMAQPSDLSQARAVDEHAGGGVEEPERTEDQTHHDPPGAFMDPFHII